MHIQSEPAHGPPLVDLERQRGGTHDNDGFVLSAHPGKSQGRPRTTSSSKLISQNGLPDRVSQQRPTSREPKGFRQGRTAVSSPDNAMVYRHGRAFAQLLTHHHARHIRTPPYTPRWNGKVERFIQTLDHEWAHGRAWDTSTQRDRGLASWLRYYNRRRPHTSLGDRPPISRVHQDRKQDT